MGVFKEIAKADGSGTTTFYRLSSEEDTVETTSTDGTSTMIDYNSMLNKPSINDVALVGNKTLEDLGIQPAGDYLTAVPEEYITEEELEAKDYATETFVMEQINNTEHFHREIVDALPLTGKDNVLYLVPKKGSDKDIYNEYIWTGADYEFMGTTAVDLTDYYQKNEVDELLGTKVNKVSGKQLSTNDYTTAEKTKLASLENYDDGELRSKVDSLHNYDDTAVKLDIQELKRDTSTNEIDIASIENELGYKAEVIRLIKNGDWWICQDAKGNNLTLEMAMNRLGLPKTILLLENLENDGKYYPVEYKLQEKYIDIIYKDLDGITHHLNYGYNEYFTNTASGDYIHLEDSINYPYKELSIDGVCEQETTTGKNLLENKTKNSGTDKGITFTLNSDGSYTLNGTNDGTGNSTVFLSSSSNPTTLKAGTYYTIPTPNGVQIVGAKIGGGYFQLTANSTNQFTLSEDTQAQIYIQVPNGITTTYNNIKVYPMISTTPITQTEYEPYTGKQPSPNPDYPQEIEVITDRISVKSTGKNLYNDRFSDYARPVDYRICPIKLEQGQQYVLKATLIGTTVSGVVVAIVPYGTQYSHFSTKLNMAINNAGDTKSILITPDGTWTSPKLVIYASNEETFNNIFKNYEIQLEKSSVATDYEPYKENSITANLPEGEFIGKINDTYKDTLKVEYNEEDGQYHLNLYKNIGKVILNGSENWNLSTSYNAYSFWKDNTNLGAVNDIIPKICNNFIYSSTSFNDAPTPSLCENTGQTRMFIFKTDGSHGQTTQEWKNWLSTHNTEVYYPLAEPYIVDLGIVDMPITYDGATNLYTDSNLLPAINIEYYTEILENAKDDIIGQDIYLQDEVDTLNDLPTEANKGDIRKVKDTGSWYIYDGTIWSAFDKSSEIDLTNYLAKDNTIPYAPSTDYNPATKRYVDTKVDALFIPTKVSQLTNDSGFVLKSVNDLTNYYNKSNTYNKAEVNALVAGGGGGSNVSITVNGDTLVITTK